MVTAPENLTRICGTVRVRREHPQLPNWDVVTMIMESAVPIAGRADMLSRRRGSVVDVCVRRNLIDGLGKGDRLACRAKLTPAGVMCETEPPTGEFVITPAHAHTD